MYDDSAGAMYEQEEYARKEALRRKKLLIRRIVVVSTILVVSLHTIFFLVDQSRFKKGQKPLITFKEVTKTYNDGTITSRYGLGWVFREYNRESLLDTEMVPFWKRIRQDYDAATTVDSNLPQVVTGYEVPDNPDELEKVDGVIFLYDGGHLLDTYKCILSDTDCEIATSYLYSDEVSGMYDVKMSIVDKRYAFIREYQDKGTENEISYVLLYDIKNKQLLAEVDDLQDDIVKVRFLGEIVNGKLVGGVLRKPKIDASIRVIEQSEIPMIVGRDEPGYMLLGVSPFYNDHPVYLDVNNFFSNHFAIFGNSGSGKSCGISRIMQNMFMDKRLFPYKSNILIFDASGEYYNAFKDLNRIDSNYHYRFLTTNETDGIGEPLRLPIFLLNETDIALLLQASNHSQLPIIERMLKLARIFAQGGDANRYKNHLIAKAIMTILYSNETSPHKRNEVFSILASCSTPEFNLESPVQGIGYVRKFRECFLIDSHGQFSESVLLTE